MQEIQCPWLSQAGWVRWRGARADQGRKRSRTAKRSRYRSQASDLDRRFIEERDSETGVGIRGSDFAQGVADDALAAGVDPESGRGEPRGGIAMGLIERELVKVAPQKDGEDEGKEAGGARRA
jgi:hypothetical protein